MSISNEWHIDYYNQLIVHASILVYHSGVTGTFTIGETVTFNTTESAIVVASDETDNILFLAYHSDVPAGTITGAESGATVTVASTGAYNSARIIYTGTGGSWTVGERVQFAAGSVYGTVVSDDDTNKILVVKYVNGTISDGDSISGGAGGEAVSGTPTINKTTYSVRQLYSYVQDTFDELVQMDDTVPMSAQTPTEFTLINNWFIDDESTKYLSGGAISTNGWDAASEATGIRVVAFNSGGYTSAVPSDIGLQVNCTSGYTGTLLAYDNSTRKWYVRADSLTDTFDTGETVEVTTAGGTGTGTSSGAADTGEHLWANIYTLGTIQTTPNPITYVFQNSSALSEWWGRGDFEAHIDVLIKVQDEGGLIGGGTGALTIFVRQFGDLFDHFLIENLQNGGRNAVPLATQADLNNIDNGEATLTLTSGAGFTANNFIRGETSRVYAEILDVDGNNVTVGNIVGDYSDPTDLPPGDIEFSNGETVYETIDGLSSGDTGTSTTTAAVQSNVVAGYSDIAIVFVNYTVTYTSLTGTVSVGDTVTGSVSGNTFYVLNIDTGTTTVTLGNASGAPSAGEHLEIDVSNRFETIGGITIASTMEKAFEQGSNNDYNVIVNCAGRTMAQVYEWFKYVTREDANSTQMPSTPEHSIMYRVNDAETAIIQEDGEEYISAKTTYTPSKASPFGTFAGGKLFGARGVWVENMHNDDRQNFQLIDADGSTQTPPNFITITVNSVVSGDKVSVFRTSSGTTIAKTQFTSDTGNNSGDPDFVVEQAIPSDTPSSGYLRVVDTVDTSINRESRYAYSSWTSSTFTLSGATTLDRTYTQTTDTAYVPYYDEIAADTTVSVTVIFNANQTVLTRVRQYDNVTPTNSILPFQITGTVTSSGYTVAAIRTNDTIVTSYP